MKLKIIFLLFTYSCFSQTTLKGTVTDSLQVPLSYANVISKPQDSLKNLQFSITDDQGRYKLELAKGKYTITASYLGYDSYSFKYNATNDTTRNIILKEQENKLDEVVIELPVMVKEDTITYNTKKFVTGDERKLKNVLKKLPGIEVNKDGTVTSQGKKITTMLVDGKKFFGGGTKLAVENIPANAVDKVEVIDNYNEVAFLKNLSDSDEMAMNIKLKEDKKQFVFGDVEAGKGNQDFYRTHSNLFYYSPKTNLNFIGNLNNTAEKTFTYKDYFNFQGGINAIFKRGSSIFRTSNSDFEQFLNTRDLTKSQNKFAALNITQEVTNKLDISGYGIFSNSKEETFEQSTNQYTTFNEIKDTKNNSKSGLVISKITFDYTPNSKEQWYFKTQFKKTNNSNNNTINSLINSVNNTFLTTKDINATYFNQNIEWHKKASSKHTFSFVADVTFDKNNPTTFWQTTNPILQGLIPVINEPIYNLKQLKETKNTNIETIFKHFWVLNRNNHIYSTVGNTNLKQSFFTDDSQELANGTTNNFNTSDFGNNLIFKLNDLFLGVHYKFRTGIFTFKQGAFIHSYNWKVNQQTKTAKNKIIVLPDFLAKIEFSKSKKIKLNYNLKTRFSNALKFANQFYLQSYNSVYKGNENLENELYHQARLRYSRFSMYRGIMLFANASYTKKVKGVKNTVDYQGINQYLSPILINNPEERWSLNGNLRKKIKNINYKVGLSYNTSKYLQKINTNFEKNKSNNTSFNISAKTLYDDFPTIEIGFKQSIGNYTSSNTTSKFITNEPFINIDYDFLDGFIFSFDYTKYDYQNKTFSQKNKYELANASLYYKKEDSAWSFEIKAKNLFDVNFKNRNSFSSYIISDTKTYILPKIVMFTVGYNL